jgi:hypothetical protein
MRSVIFFLFLTITGTVFAQFPPVTLYDVSGNPYPSGGGAPLGGGAPGVTCYTRLNGATVPCVFSGGGGSGTVTSVTFTGDGVVDSSTPSTAVTTSGTVTATINTQAANTAFGNFTGSTAAPTFAATTGTGSPVAATSPTLVTPALGTPASGVITNLTGTCTACTANSAATATSATTAANLSGGGTATATPAASTSAIFSNVAIFSGGNGTTTFPYWLAQPTAASAVTTWSTSGTIFGINAPTGTGNEIDVHLNGAASLFTVANGGVTGNGNFASTATNGAAKMAGFFSNGTKFTAAGCTSITSTAGGGSAGKFTIGANTCTVVITIAGAAGLPAPTGWSCHANDETTAAGNTGLYFSTNNTTTATLTVPAAAVASDVIDFNCMAF